MTDWIAELGRLRDAGEPSVLLTVAGIRGSAPRETGAKMLVTRTDTIGSIGGGQLEHQCTREAVQQIVHEERASRLRKYSLGANCGQCCGGVVEVLFNYVEVDPGGWVDDVMLARANGIDAMLVSELRDGYTKRVVFPGEKEVVTTASVVDGELIEALRVPDFNVAVFGAGHVGTALVDVLSRLDCKIRWIDSRYGMFPSIVPGNVCTIDAAEPSREVAAMPPGSYFVIMTHSHPLDLEIVGRVLARDDVAYAGLIGSVSKRRRFERLLRKQELSDARIETLVCPIGIGGIRGKKPVEIAVAVSAEILQVRDAARTGANVKPFLEALA